MASLPLLTVNVTSDVYQSLLPFVPDILIVPAVGLVTSTFIVEEVLELFPALSIAVRVYVTLLVSLFITPLAGTNVSVLIPLKSSVDSVWLTSTLDTYQSFNPIVPANSIVPISGSVWSTFIITLL